MVAARKRLVSSLSASAAIRRPTWPRVSSAPLSALEGSMTTTRNWGVGGLRSLSAMIETSSGDQRNWFST